MIVLDISIILQDINITLPDFNIFLQEINTHRWSVRGSFPAASAPGSFGHSPLVPNMFILLSMKCVLIETEMQYFFHQNYPKNLLPRGCFHRISFIISVTNVWIRVFRFHIYFHYSRVSVHSKSFVSFQGLYPTEYYYISRQFELLWANPCDEQQWP